jgi:hypothetical protein
VHFGLGDWEKILNKYKISFVVLSKKDNKRTIEFIGDNPGWKKVYEDEVGTIFVRKLPMNTTNNSQSVIPSKAGVQ